MIDDIEEPWESAEAWAEHEHLRDKESGGAMPFGSPPPASITHIAGADIMIGGRRLRQRCSWCGAVLIDYDLANVSVQVEPGEKPEPPSTWPVGRLVRVSGTFPKMTTLLEETEELPDDACGRIDDEVTSQ